jgi:predicted lysophospholipase L1 biosynthesis ABC-type transport system permease subunit
VDADRPISTVRVRVEGAVGMDSLSQERVRVIADQIRRATGLQVDLLVGSSTVGVPVLLPAGKFGRPALTVNEPWLKLGVAATIVSAIDRKSLILAVLVMVACALAVGNATSAAVRTRTTELGVLACLGWPRSRLFALVMTEALAIGAVAGMLGTILALALSPVLDIGLHVSFALLAVPAALLLCLLSALLPAWRATRADPAAAVRPQVALVRRKRVPHRVSGLALGNVLRAPGRTVVGALSLSIGVAALTLLIIVNTAFRGSASGTVLGDAITLQVQKADYIAAALTTLLGVATVADVLYVNIRERSAEFALLGAVGWTDGMLTRLAGYETVVLGALGSVTGAGLALATAAGFSGALPSVAYLVAGVTIPCGIMLTVAASVFPVRALRSLSTAQLLAEE